jgi:hypothetical protein
MCGIYVGLEIKHLQLIQALKSEPLESRKLYEVLAKPWLYSEFLQLYAGISI